jgi:hypothetical protein
VPEVIAGLDERKTGEQDGSVDYGGLEQLGGLYVGVVRGSWRQFVVDDVAGHSL